MNGRAVSDKFGSLCIFTDQSGTKDVCHGCIDVFFVADKIQSQIDLVRGEVLGCTEFLLLFVSIKSGDLEDATHLCRSPESRNLVQWDDCDSLLQLALLQQLCTSLCQVDNDIVEPAAGTDLQSSSSLSELFIKSKELSHKTLDFRPIKIGRGITIAEVDVCNTPLQAIGLPLEFSNPLLETRLFFLDTFFSTRFKA